MRSAHIDELLRLLPDKPGCYLMKNKDGVVIYVGKAKILKNRVKSYFIGSHNAKTTLLVSEIVDFEYIVTNSELESLVLELNLIKKYTPYYNIKLMDDKTYPYILITADDNPQLLIVRNNKKKGQMFGPYPNVTAARDTIRLLNTLYPLRKCFNIPKKECLYYHMKQCLAPCINKITRDDYKEYLKKVVSFLKGDTTDSINELKAMMQKYSDNLEYEKALECLNLINSVNATVEKQKIITKDKIDRDVFGYFFDELDICIYVLYVRGGKIIGKDQTVLNLVDDPLEMFENYIALFYQKNPIQREILLPKIDDLEVLEVLIESRIIVPQKGEKKDLVDMAMENAEITLKNLRELNRNKIETRKQALMDLSKLLDISYPRRIEAFDNSNILGSDPVSAMVCFIDGEKAPSEYRKYKVKTVEGPDDYATTKEVVYRRYLRVIMEDLPRPDLIIMDGGKGQINAVLESLNSLNININVMGLKKDDNHKTDTIIFNEKEYNIKNNRNLFQLCYMIQEEVHRFAISFHKKQRSKSAFRSSLDGIKGLGPKGKEKIMKQFKSINGIKNSTKADFDAIGLGKLYGAIMDKLNDK